MTDQCPFCASYDISAMGASVDAGEQHCCSCNRVWNVRAAPEDRALVTLPCPDLVKGVSFETRTPILARCPVDGKRDRYDVRIEYEPTGSTVEAASLWHYLREFSTRSISGEALAAEIAGAIKNACACAYCVVVVDQVEGESLRLKVTARA